MKTKKEIEERLITQTKHYAYLKSWNDREYLICETYRKIKKDVDTSQYDYTATLITECSLEIDFLKWVLNISKNLRHDSINSWMDITFCKYNCARVYTR